FDQRLHFKAFIPEESREEAVKQSREVGPKSSLVGQAYYKQAYVIDSDMHRPNSLARPVHPSSRSCIVVPLSAANRRLGVLSCDKFEPSYFDEEHATTLQCFGHVAAAFIMMGRLLKEK